MSLSGVFCHWVFLGTTLCLHYPDVFSTFSLVFWLFLLCCLVSTVVLMADDSWIFRKSFNFLLEFTPTSNVTSFACFVGSNVKRPAALGISTSVWMVPKTTGFVDKNSCWFDLTFLLRRFDWFSEILLTVIVYCCLLARRGGKVWSWEVLAVVGVEHQSQCCYP